MNNKILFFTDSVATVKKIQKFFFITDTSQDKQNE